METSTMNCVQVFDRCDDKLTLVCGRSGRHPGGPGWRGVILHLVVTSRGHIQVRVMTSWHVVVYTVRVIPGFVSLHWKIIVLTVHMWLHITLAGVYVTVGGASWTLCGWGRNTIGGHRFNVTIHKSTCFRSVIVSQLRRRDIVGSQGTMFVQSRWGHHFV